MEMTGFVESVEKQKQLFPSSHAPLEISPKARDSHIPTATRRPGWKSGKPKSGFPLSHAGLATTATVCPDLEPKTKKGDRPLRGLLLIFQDHLVLETGTDFRSILRLENATETKGHSASQRVHPKFSFSLRYGDGYGRRPGK